MLMLQNRLVHPIQPDVFGSAVSAEITAWSQSVRVFELCNNHDNSCISVNRGSVTPLLILLHKQFRKEEQPRPNERPSKRMKPPHVFPAQLVVLPECVRRHGQPDIPRSKHDLEWRDGYAVPDLSLAGWVHCSPRFLPVGLLMLLLRIPHNSFSLAPTGVPDHCYFCDFFQSRNAFDFLTESSSTVNPSGCCLQNSTTSGVRRIPTGIFRPSGAGRPVFCLSFIVVAFR